MGTFLASFPAGLAHPHISHTNAHRTRVRARTHANWQGGTGYHKSKAGHGLLVGYVELKRFLVRMVSVSGNDSNWPDSFSTCNDRSLMTCFEVSRQELVVPAPMALVLIEPAVGLPVNAGCELPIPHALKRHP